MEDNGMAIFRMKSGATASVHASLTHWKIYLILRFIEDGYPANGLEVVMVLKN